MKVIITPTLDIGHHWCQSMCIPPSEYKLIALGMPYRGITEVYTYIFGEPFDYPEQSYPEFEAFCEEVEGYLDGRVG